MDEANAPITHQPSIGSDSNGEETHKSNPSSERHRRICLVGPVGNDTATCSAAVTFGHPVVTSTTGEEYIDDRSTVTVFVVDSFEGDTFQTLYKAKQTLLGSAALQQLAAKKEPLPNNTRPLFNLSMMGVIVCFTGFRNKDDLTRLVPLMHHMGGSIRKDMSSKVTHLIANVCGGEKYQYAATFRVPVMNSNWVFSSWERRNELDFSATQDTFIAVHKLKPFHGARVCFLGFPEEEEQHMTEVLVANGGTATTLDDPLCSHVVMERSEIYTLEQPQESSNNASISSSPQLTISSASNTPYSKIAVTPDFETLVEDETDITLRKRKCDSPTETVVCKRKRDRSCCSETKGRKLSDVFKTPINYFTNRRRTIGGASAGGNKSLNESVVSSSGVFDVTVVQNLDRTDDSMKKPRRSLFNRTFSSSTFSSLRKKRKESMSFAESECDGDNNLLNASCFPEFTGCHSSASGDLHTAPSNAPPSVVDEASVVEKPENPSKAHFVKAEWFWTSVQKEISLNEKEYLFDDILTPSGRRDSNHHQQPSTPSSASRRKRKRLHETLSSLAHHHQQSPGLHKRRSSVSDAGLLSVSGSFLDCTASPDGKGLDGDAVLPETPRKALTARQQVFLELVQTESNYVNILHTIMTMFKKHLEEMPEEEALLNATEMKIIFGNLPPIYDTHVRMLDELKWMSRHWSEDKKVGDLIVKYSNDLLKAYPPFINYFEPMKEELIQCDANKPRFHAFLKACQTRSECGRQTLQDLLIRPVQRLGSISLLLSDILKHTPKSNPDNAALAKALAAVKEVMTHINEDKRKTEGQRVLFDIFNDIDNCPPDIVSSHRHFIDKSEVIQLSSSEGLSSKGANLMLFLFSDQLEVCKRRSKAMTLKSPNTTGANGLHQKASSSVKQYKHVKLMPLNTIKRVIDIKETEDCQKVFSLVLRNNEELKERLYTFAMADETADKTAFLKTLVRQMANNACKADPDQFLAYLEPHQLDIDTSDVSNGTLSKAFKFATRTRLRVGRAFSFNKTPSKLKRAVSSMMSPFGSSTNLTPASQLAQMRLASYSNINEIGNAENSSESPPVAPMSVQPTRKMKSSSLGNNAMKRF